MILLNESKIKYDKLDELLSDQLSDIRFSQSVNIIIDLKDIFKKLFRPDLPLDMTNKRIVEEIAADVINTVAHYRNYFYKKDKYTTFYLLYSKTKCDYFKNIIPDYKKDYYEKFDSPDMADRKSVLDRTVTVVEKIIQNVPNCTFVDTYKFDELCYARYIVERAPNNEMTLILTNDDILYQLINKHAFVLNLKGIKSLLVTKDNMYNVFLKDNEKYSIGPELFPLILSISGNKKYSFANISGYAMSRSIKLISKLLEDGCCNNISSIEPPINFDSLSEKDKLHQLILNNKEFINKNYDYITRYSTYYGSKIIIEAELQPIPTRSVYNYFLELNAKVFNTFPINIDMLVKGERI